MHTSISPLFIEIKILVLLYLYYIFSLIFVIVLFWRERERESDSDVCKIVKRFCILKYRLVLLEKSLSFMLF